jgi:hypothetical protein
MRTKVFLASVQNMKEVKACGPVRYGRTARLSNLESRISTAMLTTDRRAQRALAKSQSGILAALDGDPAGIVAIDEITCDATVVAAHQRIHVYRRGGKSQQRVVDLTSISSAYTNGPCASLGGTGVSVTFRDKSSADKFKVAINRMIIASRPRTIPVLYPNYFLGLLAAAKVPSTPMNVARLVERTAFITGGQGAVYCAQLGEPRALEELISLFARNIHVQPGGNLSIVDNIIDWLWAWNPGCHQALERQIQKWHDGCLKPGSFLVAGTDILPWDDSNDSDSSDAWRMMYARNLR